MIQRDPAGPLPSLVYSKGPAQSGPTLENSPAKGTGIKPNPLRIILLLAFDPSAPSTTPRHNFGDTLPFGFQQFTNRAGQLVVHCPITSPSSSLGTCPTHFESGSIIILPEPVSSDCTPAPITLSQALTGWHPCTPEQYFSFFTWLCLLILALPAWASADPILQFLS